jgi:uncharacterized protein (TIGR02302 family)
MPETGRLISRKILAARLVMTMERAVSALFWPLMAAGVSAFIVLTGIVATLAPLGRAVFWLVALGGLAAGLWRARHVRIPNDAEAVARLERESGLSLRPLTALRDRLAAGEDSLWAAHQARMVKEIARVRRARPHFDFATRDPYALRNGLMLLLFAAFVLRGGEGVLVASLPQLSGSSQSLQVDGWITPPAYTDKPPMLLAKGEVIGVTEPIAVPVGSTVLLRIAGARKAQLQFGPPDAQKPIGLQAASASLEARLEVKSDGTLTLSDGWRELGQWNLQIVADAAPEARLPEMPEVSKTGQLILPFAISDDYGVNSLTLHFALADEQADGEGISGDGAFLAKPPEVAVTLSSVNLRAAAGKALADLTKHAWAGLSVEAWVEARDGAGQMGVSNRLTFQLPERKFISPVSQALAEQRRFLLRDTQDMPRVVAALDALTIWPQGVVDNSGRYLELKSITRKIYRATDFAAVETAAEDLWTLAVALDGGDLVDARVALDAARKALEDALAQGASGEEIERLVAELKAAMERYLAAMADAARRGELAAKPSDGKPRRNVTPQELSKMLDEMQALSERGAADKALDMLAELDQILKNLQMGQAQAGGNPDASLLREFSKLMRDQQQLMDRTFSLPQGGEESGEGEGQSDGQNLARDQGELGKGLSQLMDRLGEQGMAVPEGLNRAQEQMQGAGKALQAPDRNSALSNQQQALNDLRESFDEVARQMMGDEQSEPGQQSQTGQDGNEDPLGRPRASNGAQQSNQENVVPGEAPARTARRILDELRRRSGAPGLESLERDYIERLLRGLY